MSYLMDGRPSELERLQLQSLVWEDAGRRLLRELGDGRGRSVLDVGCGALGWLRVLSEWIGEDGHCTGTDVSAPLLEAADRFARDEGLANVTVALDDLFDSRLPDATFDLVHARFQLAPLGRFDEQLDAYSRLLRPGGVLVLEDPDSVSWSYTPDAPATRDLVDLVVHAFNLAGGDFDAGRVERDLLVARGMEPQVRAEVLALAPGHPYLRLPLQFAESLRPRLLEIVDPRRLEELLERARAELERAGTRGLTFTLMQTWATRA